MVRFMKNKRLTIGVLIGNANSPHAKMLMKGIYDVAKKMDVNVIFFLGVHMTSYFREYLGTGTDKRYDYQYKKTPKNIIPKCVPAC